jgi:hypothetical protein
VCDLAGRCAAIPGDHKDSADHPTSHALNLNTSTLETDSEDHEDLKWKRRNTPKTNHQKRGDREVTLTEGSLLLSEACPSRTRVVSTCDIHAEELEVKESQM